MGATRPLFDWIRAGVAWSTVALLVTACSSPSPEPTTEPTLAATESPTTLLAQTYTQAPYDTVWSYLTETARFGEWHSSPALSFGHTVGDSLIWGTDDGPLYVGTLESYEPGSGFEHTFSFTFTHTREPSLVSWDVEANGPVVWVRVTHDVSEAPETAAVITEVGWTKSLERLKTLLETGEAMPWPEEPGT